MIGETVGSGLAPARWGPDEEVRACPAVYVHAASGRVAPMIVVEFKPLPVRIQREPLSLSFPILDHLDGHGWSPCTDLFDAGRFSSDALVPVRVTALGAVTIEDGLDVLFTGALGAVPPVWVEAVRYGGQVVVLAGVLVALHEPGWQDQLAEVARRGFLLGAIGAATLPSSWPAH